MESFLTHCKEVLSVESFITLCVETPPGSFLPLPKHLAPTEENDEDYDLLEELQMTIRDSDFMNERFKLARNEALILMFIESEWRVYHINFLCL